jgi:hypothetical protein
MDKDPVTLRTSVFYTPAIFRRVWPLTTECPSPRLEVSRNNLNCIRICDISVMFVVYFSTPTSSPLLQRRFVGRLASNELETTCEEAVVAWCKYCKAICLEKLSKPRKSSFMIAGVRAARDWKRVWISILQDICAGEDRTSWAGITSSITDTCMCVTINGVWIGEWIYWTLTNRNYN